MPLAAPVRRLNANHDIQGGGLAAYATGSEATAQRVRTTLLAILGEWWLDETIGVPWLGPEDPNDPNFTGVPTIMGQPGAPDLGYAEAVIKAAILGIDGVESIDSFTMDFDHQTRTLSFSTNWVDEDGNVFPFALEDPGP
jgi:hypothetical protein